MWSIRINEENYIEMCKLVSDDFIENKLRKLLQSKIGIRYNREWKYGITRLIIKIPFEHIEQNKIIKEILQL